ncbi:hypothetical protein [uncultured Microbulbifer sp.]|uniref:hypothetical protein n=1 Tax=uncultured Microbulbifer sp. TaxID=348147 RepID=UPI002604EC0F|nr:hypothetical protein [uncultured Microbulbifer sp.]
MVAPVADVITTQIMKSKGLKRAEYLIYGYAHDWYIQLRLLAAENLEEAINLPSHGLSDAELEQLLARMFREKCLVATSRDRGLFSPSRKELRSALTEPPSQDELFYGYTSAAVEKYEVLSQEFGDEL